METAAHVFNLRRVYMIKKLGLVTLLITLVTLSPGAGLLSWPLGQPTVMAWSEPTYTSTWSESLLTEESPQQGQQQDVQQPEQPQESQTELWTDNEDVPEELPPIDESLLDFERLYGRWYIWTPSTAAGLFSTHTGEYVTHEFTPGVGQGVVVINEDQTYSMSHGAWGGNQVVEGTWRLSHPGEINGERLVAIILKDGITNTDWAVAPSENGGVRLLWAMTWADGSATWIYDSNLYQE